MDWYSRYVLSWRVSTTLESTFCIEALREALKVAHPRIFNSDQGRQFTSREFTAVLDQEGIRISMDGRGRVYDNIFVERLWRSVKYEDVYLKDYRTVVEAIEGIGSYFIFYNHERLHQSLGYKTPGLIYFKEREIKNKQFSTLPGYPGRVLNRYSPLQEERNITLN